MRRRLTRRASYLAENRRIAEVESAARIGVATDMAARKEDLGKQANAHVAEEMKKILGKVLDKWSRDAQDEFAASVDTPYPERERADRERGFAVGEWRPAHGQRERVARRRGRGGARPP